MRNINYSFIIPHHNSPQLLNRCLDSIPERDDVQIVVIDDNSQDDKRPTFDRPDVEIYYIDAAHTKGAGHARNVGLKHAIGEWIIFADADDCYTDCFLEVLDRYKDCDSDVIYFNYYEELNTPQGIIMSKEGTCVDLYDGSKNACDAIKYQHVPWNKMVKKDLIDKHSIQFEEVIQGNDTMYSFHVGYRAKKVKVIKDRLYIYKFNNSSITKKKKQYNQYNCALENHIKQSCFTRHIGHPEYNISLLHLWIRTSRQRGFRDAFLFLWVIMREWRNAHVLRNKYIDIICK